jgi:hypothetical protein
VISKHKPREIIVKKISIIALTLLISASNAFADFAGSTPIETAVGEVAISSLQVGDNVTTLAVNSSIDKLGYEQNKVMFSAGAEGEQLIMIYMTFGDNQNLIVSLDQVFPLASGKYEKASNLVPGDQLISRNGESVEITFLSSGMYKGRVHHVAVSPNTNIANTLVVNGVLVGSFLQQIHFNEIKDQSIFSEIHL